MSELWWVEICLIPLTRIIAYTTACCYHTSHDSIATYWSSFSTARLSCGWFCYYGRSDWYWWCDVKTLWQRLLIQCPSDRRTDLRSLCSGIAHYSHKLWDTACLFGNILFMCNCLWSVCSAWAQERCRISPPPFLAECRMRRQNQG